MLHCMREEHRTTEKKLVLLFDVIIPEQMHLELNIPHFGANFRADDRFSKLFKLNAL